MNRYLGLLIKKRTVVFFLPVIGAFFLLGFLSQYYLNLYSGSIETIKMYVIPNFHLIISLMSCWWIILLFAEITSSGGNEVFYLYSSLKGVLVSTITLEMFYIFITSLFFLFFYRELHISPFFLALLCGEILFMSGLAFFIIHLTKNTSLALGIIAVYTVYLLKFDSMQIMSSISIFPLQDMMTTDSIFQIMEDIILALVFYFFGGVCYRKRIVYY